MPLVLSHCCFCIELRTGSLIIGYINLIWNLILTLLLIIGFTLVGYTDSQLEDTSDNKAFGTAGYVILGIATVFVIINLIFAILLLVGLHQNKRGHVKAYLIYTVIFLVLGVIAFIASIAQGSPAKEIIKYFFNLLFSIYFLIVIRSHWLKMDDPSKRPAIYNTA